MKVALNGRGGKVGSVLAPALEAAGHELVELDDAEAVVDFTAPEAVVENVERRSSAGSRASSGRRAGSRPELSELAEEKGVALFYAPNFAIGAVLMMRFAAEAARHLPRAEIIELHGEAKKDAPSGTARATAERIGGAEIHSVRLPASSPTRKSCSAATGSCSRSGTTPSTARRTCPASCSRSRSSRACRRGSPSAWRSCLAELERGKQRCYVVYAVAPDGVTARQANELLNEYVADRRRGFVVFHDHFTGKPHGGFAVFDVRDREAFDLLEDHGPLQGWDVAVHALTFSMAATGFAAQMDLTAEEYGGKTLAERREEEGEDERFWWLRRG